MSIYGTETALYLDVGWQKQPVEIHVQAVPAWVYFVADWLPPPRPGIPESKGYLHPRAAVFVIAGSPKGGEGFDGQQYHQPLLVMSGEEYERATFRDLMALLADAVEKARPQS